MDKTQSQVEQDAMAAEPDVNSVEPAAGNVSMQKPPSASQSAQQPSFGNELFGTTVDMLSLKWYTTPEAFWTRVIHLFLRPYICLANMLIPWDMMNRLQESAEGLVEKLNPTFMLRPCLMFCGAASIFFTTALIVFWVSLFQYAALYYVVMPENYVSQPLNFGPADNSERLTSKLFMRENVVTLPQSDYQLQNMFTPELAMIRLEPSQSYNVTVLFEVAETHHNMALGNLYLVAKIQQCNQPGYAVTRMGVVDFRSDLQIHLRDVMNTIPLGNFLAYLFSSKMSDNQHQMIEINLGENLPGDLCLLELELANANLQFKSAMLQANLRLDLVSVFSPFGMFRYFIHDWFWISLTIGMITIQSFNWGIILIVVLVVYQITQKVKIN